MKYTISLSFDEYYNAESVIQYASILHGDSIDNDGYINSDALEPIDYALNGVIESGKKTNEIHTVVGIFECSLSLLNKISDKAFEVQGVDKNEIASFAKRRIEEFLANQD